MRHAAGPLASIDRTSREYDTEPIDETLSRDVGGRDVG